MSGQIGASSKFGQSEPGRAARAVGRTRLASTAGSQPGSSRSTALRQVLIGRVDVALRGRQPGVPQELHHHLAARSPVHQPGAEAARLRTVRCESVVMSLPSSRRSTRRSRLTASPFTTRGGDPDSDFTIWASTPAILWTADREQEEGLHVHVHKERQRIIDETFGDVILKGKHLDRNELFQAMIARTIK